jgi:hypothetical protein
VAAENLLAYQHGERYERRCGPQALAGALLMARGLNDLHAWVEAHRKHP